MTALRRRSGPVLATVVREGAANVVCAPLRSCIVATICAAVAFGVVAFSCSDVGRLAARYADDVRAGRFVVVARSADPAGLDVGRCDALNSLAGVRAAGAVMGSRDVYPAAAPARPYELLSVTPGLLRAWFPDADPSRAEAGWLVGPIAAAELGLTDHAFLATADEVHTVLSVGSADVVRVTGVLPGSPRREEAERRLFEVAAPAGRAASCVIDAEPSSFEAIDQAASGWFPEDQRVGVTSFLEGADRTRSPEADLARRSSGSAPWVGAGVIAVVAAFSWYGRREEYALYRLLGASPSAVAGILACEAMWTIAIPAIVGAAVAVAANRGPLAVLTSPVLAGSTAGRLIGLDLLCFLIALVPVPLVGFAAISRRSPFDQLKGG